LATKLDKIFKRNKYFIRYFVAGIKSLIFAAKRSLVAGLFELVGNSIIVSG